ncbi:hypothetical protein R3P38DRAFT_3245420 [Favolaschia claudopus]|uniref:Uncharacterized protein n=1 Tax=Favolaschia claudopus TaxID=2862362 RepID=A0AAV9Z0H4_9AGAR
MTAESSLYFVLFHTSLPPSYFPAVKPEFEIEAENEDEVPPLLNDEEVAKPPFTNVAIRTVDLTRVKSLQQLSIEIQATFPSHRNIHLQRGEAYCPYISGYSYMPSSLLYLRARL